MYDYDPSFYIADGCQNHNDLAMAPHRDPHNYGEPMRKPPFVPYGPKPPICPCHHHGEPGKLPPIKRPDHDDKYYEHPPYIPSAQGCNCKIPDRVPVSNIINVESQLLITLKITLYGVREEDDKTVILENGKEYIITYITEDGVRQITGILRYIDYNIPTECVRYIGEYNTVTDQSYIIVDGSTAGYSNIIKVFIRSLRDIVEVKKEESKDPDDNNKGDGSDKDPDNKGDGSDKPSSGDNKNPDGTDKDDGKTDPPSGEDKKPDGNDKGEDSKDNPSSGDDKDPDNKGDGSDNPSSGGEDKGNEGSDSKDENKNPDSTESKDDSKSDNTDTETPPTPENKDDSSETSNN